MLRRLLILGAVLVALAAFSACQPGDLEALKGALMPSATPTPSVTPLPPTPTRTATPTLTSTLTVTVTPLPTLTPTPSGLPQLDVATHSFRILAASALEEWAQYGLRVERLLPPEGRVILVLDVELVDRVNPIDLLPGPGSLPASVFLTDDRQRRYPAEQMIVTGERMTAPERARLVFQGLPVNDEGEFTLHFIGAPGVTFLLDQPLSVLNQPAPPLALTGPGAQALAVEGYNGSLGTCPPDQAFSFDLSTLGVIQQGQAGGSPAGPVYRVTLPQSGQTFLVRDEFSAWDGMVQADVRIVQGTHSSVGLAFGGDYAFLVDSAARWALVQSPESNPVILQDFTPSPAIQPGSATNRLAIAYRGEMVNLYINGIAVSPPLSLAGIEARQPGGLVVMSREEKTIIADFARYNRCSLSATAPVVLSLNSDRVPETLPGGTPLLLEYAWAASNMPLAEQFAARSSLRVTLDGQPLAQPLNGWGRAVPLGGLISSGERSVIRWQTLLSPLSPGRHRLTFRLALLQPASTGFDLDRDSRADTYGPGVLVNRVIEFNVEE